MPRLLGLAVLALVAMLVAAVPAQATVPGKNGRVVFEGFDESVIYTTNADGSNLTRVSRGQWPDWSPDGSKIVFASNQLGGDNYDLFVMNADGSGQTRLTNTFDRDLAPAWSPDGEKIAFWRRDGSGGRQIYVINPDGTGEAPVTHSAAGDVGWPDWSPDGSLIAFASGRSEIHTINPDGTGEKTITQLPGMVGGGISWSPDGERLAFDGCSPVECSSAPPSIFTVKRDGTDLARLTDLGFYSKHPAWSPDGTSILFATDVDANTGGIWIMNSDGTNPRLFNEVGGFSPSWESIPGPKRGAFKNASQFCKAEQGFWGDQFASRYGGGKNAYGKCVSGK